MVLQRLVPTSESSKVEGLSPVYGDSMAALLEYLCQLAKHQEELPIPAPETGSPLLHMGLSVCNLNLFRPA